MVRISKDIKDLLERDQKTVSINKLLYKVVIFLAIVGLVAIIAGSVNSCQDKPQPASVLEEAK